MKLAVPAVILLCVVACSREPPQNADRLIGVWEAHSEAGDRKALMEFTMSGKVLGGSDGEEGEWEFISATRDRLTIRVGKNEHELTFDGPDRFSMTDRNGVRGLFVRVK